MRAALLAFHVTLLIALPLKSFLRSGPPALVPAHAAPVELGPRLIDPRPDDGRYHARTPVRTESQVH